MKVCLINNLYSPYSVGGAERLVEEQAQKLFSDGKEVTIITARPWQGFRSIKPSAGKDGGIVIHRVWQPNIFWYKDLSRHKLFWKFAWHFFDVFNPLAERWVREILEKEKPDEVWTHNLMGIGVYKVHKVIKSIKSNVKWVHYLHDVQLVEPSGVLFWNHEQDRFYQKIYSWLMKRRLGTPDVVVALSNFIEGFYWSRRFFSGVKWRVENPKLETLNPKQIPNSNIKFLFVGSLVKHKGLEVLMQAWDAFCHPCESRDPEKKGVDSRLRRNDISLHIAGDGILGPKVEEWAKSHPEVTFHGRLENEELEKVYKNCDILIFPSICLENRPTVILEALQRGLLIIASDTGGVIELVKPNENAWLFEPGNVDELVKRMKRFV